MKLADHIFGSYDIRGVVPDDLDEDKVFLIAKAYGTFLQKRKIAQAVVARDCRLSGESFEDKFIEGLVETGIDVVKIGMLTTPMMYFAQYFLKIKGGAVITASHNPAQFNGFKLATGYSQTTISEDLAEIRQIAESGNFLTSKQTGSIVEKNIINDYYQDLLKRVKIATKIKIVVDTGNGTAGVFARELLEQAGCEVVAINEEVDGTFPNGTPDPTDKDMLDALSKVVLTKKADLGVAFDGDGDRIGVVDEKGQILWNDILIAIFSLLSLEEYPGGMVVYNNLCSQLVPELVEKNGGKSTMWLTGHSYIILKMKELGAVFGGELSGHFFFRDFYGHDDGCYAILKLLEFITKKNKPLSEITRGFPQYISSPEIKLACTVGKKKGIIEKIVQQLKYDFPDVLVSDDKVIPGNDGTRLDFDDGMMIIRYSQNGPYLTVRFEAKEERVYRQRKKYLLDILKTYPDIKWDGSLGVNLDALA